MGSAWRQTMGLTVLAALAATAPAGAAGFAIFEHGTKAMGMAGAFTAQADDPSAMFHNAGGVAFFEQTAYAAGFTYIRSTKADFEGAPPFPGFGVREEQETLSEFPPHFYWIKPINQTWKFGIGLNAPFGLTTEWQNPSQFSGRFLSTKAALRAFDINPTLGWRVNPDFGIGFGLIARLSDVELNRFVPTVNPFTQQVVNVARLELASDFNEGYGWNVGVLHRWNNSFSWGLSYRSQIDVDYEDGEARLSQVSTGIPAFDQAIRGRLPFDRGLDATTTIAFPDTASLGLAFALSPNLLLETDFNWTGWSSFERVDIDFTNDELPDATIPESWEDTNHYRAGLQWTVSPKTQLRIGYVFDETPQPEQAMSPLLPDADRNGITLGWGHTGNWDFDLAVMYLPFDERSRARNFQGEENTFFGTYNTTAWLFGLTVSR